MVRSTEGEGDRVGRWLVERGDPIALTLAASGVSTSPAPAGEVSEIARLWSSVVLDLPPCYDL